MLENGTGTIRPLSEAEVWEMQGGSYNQWQQVNQKTRKNMLCSAVQEVGWQVAYNLLGLVTNPTKIGVLDPEEVIAHDQLEIWLKAWGRNPHHPSHELYLSSWKTTKPLEPPTHWQDDVTKAGAPRKKTSSKAELVALEGLAQPRPRSQSAPPVAAIKLRGQDSLDQLATDAVMSKLADSTKKVNASGWKQWVLFNAGSRVPLFLEGESRAEKSHDEQRLIRFAVFLHQIMNRSVGGIRQSLSSSSSSAAVASRKAPASVLLVLADSPI